MRTSTYEIFLPLIGTDGKPIEGRALLLNGLYGAVDVVTQEEREIISAGEFDKLPLPVFERLSLRGHITRKTEEEEVADMRLLSRVYKIIPAGAVWSSRSCPPTTAISAALTASSSTA